jgi:hypothetical protein
LLIEGEVTDLDFRLIRLSRTFQRRRIALAPPGIARDRPWPPKFDSSGPYSTHFLAQTHVIMGAERVGVVFL